MRLNEGYVQVDNMSSDDLCSLIWGILGLADYTVLLKHHWNKHIPLYISLNIFTRSREFPRTNRLSVHSGRKGPERFDFLSYDRNSNPAQRGFSRHFLDPIILFLRTNHFSTQL